MKPCLHSLRFRDILLRQGGNLHFKKYGTLMESHVTYNN